MNQQQEKPKKRVDIAILKDYSNNDVAYELEYIQEYKREMKERLHQLEFMLSGRSDFYDDEEALDLETYYQIWACAEDVCYYPAYAGASTAHYWGRIVYELCKAKKWNEANELLPGLKDEVAFSFLVLDQYLASLFDLNEEVEPEYL